MTKQNKTGMSPFFGPDPVLTPEQRSAGLAAMRKKWFLWSLAPVLAALVVVVFIAYTLLFNAAGAKAMTDEDYTKATTQYGKLTGWKPADKWVADYNVGTSTLSSGAYLRAIESFEVAKTKAPVADPEVDYSQLPEAELPPMCLINHNLSIGYALKGNDFVTTGLPFLTEFLDVLTKMATAKDLAAYNALKDSVPDLTVEGIKHYTSAKEAYDKALEIRAELKCPDPSGASEALEEASAAAQDAIDQMQNPDFPPPPKEPEENPEPQPNENSGENGGESEPSDPGDNGGESEPSDPGENPGENPDDSDTENDPNNAGGGQVNPTEQERRDQLAERNKVGQQQRDETEGYMGGYEYSPKNW